MCMREEFRRLMIELKSEFNLKSTFIGVNCCFHTATFTVAICSLILSQHDPKVIVLNLGYASGNELRCNCFNYL